MSSTNFILQVWKSKTKKDELDWTSLRGSDRKKLLNELPPKLVHVFPNELGRQLMKHWLVSITLIITYIWKRNTYM